MRRRDLPHVTDILKDAGLVGVTWFRDFDLARGSAVHRATELLDRHDLNWETVDPVIIARIRSYQKFLDEVRPQILAIEEEVENQTLGYCGTLDRRVIVNGKETIIDLKGPAQSPWHALQLAGYAGCFVRPLVRWSLHLSDDRYLVKVHEGWDDWATFKATITIASFRRKHGV